MMLRRRSDLLGCGVEVRGLNPWLPPCEREPGYLADLRHYADRAADLGRRLTVVDPLLSLALPSGVAPAVGGGTAGAVITDVSGNGYEVTVTKSDGSKVEVHLDQSFNLDDHGRLGG